MLICIDVQPIRDKEMIEEWFQFDCVLDLAKGTENQYIVIG